MPLWFLPLAKGLAHETLSEVSQDCLDLFRAYATLQAVLDGTVEIMEAPGEGSNRLWATTSGWTIGVFDDCGEWDYIDDMVTPDGQSLCQRFGWTYFEEEGTVYQPTEDDLKRIWKWDREQTTVTLS
jgi:hypothetical protein